MEGLPIYLGRKRVQSISLTKIVIPLQLIVAAGIGPIMALKYFRYTYRPSKINVLQQAERMGVPFCLWGLLNLSQDVLKKMFLHYPLLNQRAEIQFMNLYHLILQILGLSGQLLHSTSFSPSPHCLLFT